MTLHYGYTITKEWCGDPTKRFIVRQYGDWVACFETRDEALACVASRDGVFER